MQKTAIPKRRIIYCKFLLLVIFGVLYFTKSYSQGQITIDTLKKYDKYNKYLVLSKDVLKSLKENPDSLFSDYIIKNQGHNKDYFKLDFLWAHQLIVQNAPLHVKTVLLEKSELKFKDYFRKGVSLRIEYSLGRAACADPTYENTLTVIFDDILENDNYSLEFESCADREKVIKAILAIPVPKKDSI